jgi:hypothetical protein
VGGVKLFERVVYVPVLRWKMGEWMALRTLDDATRERLLPLVEIPPSRLQSLQGNGTDAITRCAEQVAKQLERSWGVTPFLLDMILLDQLDRGSGLAARVLAAVLDECERRSLLVVPVAGLSRGRGYLEVIQEWARRHGRVCLRIIPAEMEADAASGSVSDFPDLMGSGRESSVLVVDFGLVDEGRGEYDAAWEHAGGSRAWGATVFCGGSFPADLTGYDVGIRTTPRREWIAWRDAFLSDSRGEAPLFGDYTIQHARFKEPPRRSNPSASIRYALEDSWLIMRGEGLYTSDLGNAQYAGHAIILVDREEYYGPGFSSGDRYIMDVAEGRVNPGSPMSWIRAGVNHHLTLVAKQLQGTRA